MNTVNLRSRNKAGISALKCAQSNGIQPIKEVEHSLQKKYPLTTSLHLDFPRKTAGKEELTVSITRGGNQQ